MLYGRDIENGDDCDAEFLIAEVEDYKGAYTANIYIGVHLRTDLVEII